MTATFFRCGRGRSINAQNAEFQGRHPLTRAVKALRDLAADNGKKLTIKQAKLLLETVHDGEWHHVGKYAARVKYYSVSAAWCYYLNRWLLQAGLEDQVNELRKYAELLPVYRDEAGSKYDITNYLRDNHAYNMAVEDMLIAELSIKHFGNKRAAKLAYYEDWEDLAEVMK